MRVTQSMMTQNFLYNITNDNSAMQTLENELSTGKTLNEPSDNPVGVSQDMQINTTIAQTAAYQSTISAGQTWMSNTSNAVQSILSTLQSVQGVVIQGMNTPNQSTSAKAALAATAQSYLDNIKQVMDSKQDNRYLFGGTADSTAPSTYLFGAGTPPAGASNALNYEVAPGVQVPINLTATAVMQSTPTGASADLQTTLTNIVSDLSSGSESALQADLNNLTANTTQVTNLNAGLGSTQIRLTALQNQMSQYATTITNEKGVIEDANMAQVITQFNTDQTVYEAALKMGSQVLLPSLVSYLP